MKTLSITYSYKYYVSFAPEYVFTTCGKCVNLKRGTIVRHVLKRYTKGFNIRGKFYSDKKLKPYLTKGKQDCPF
jgi:hypothetical protein